MMARTVGTMETMVEAMAEMETRAAETTVRTMEETRAETTARRAMRGSPTLAGMTGVTGMTETQETEETTAGCRIWIHLRARARVAQAAPLAPASW